MGERLTVKRAVEMVLMVVCCLLLALVRWQENPGDVWAVIGLVLAPLCSAGVVLLVAYAVREVG